MSAAAQSSQPRNAARGDTSAALAFIALYAELAGLTSITLCSKLPDDGGMDAHAFAIEDVGGMRAWIDARQGQRNIYFVANEAPPGLHKKPAKADMLTARAAFCDVDPIEAEETKPGGFTRERERIRHEFDMLLLFDQGQPSFLIDSGNGFQPVWIFDNPITLDSEGIGRAEGIGKALRVKFGGDAVDNVDRVLRLPGTINLPNAGKRARGRKVTLAKLVYGSGKRYSLNDLWRVASDGAAQGTIAPILTNARRKPIGDPSLMAADMEEFGRAVDALPNVLGYSATIKVLAAIKAGCGDDFAFLCDHVLNFGRRWVKTEVQQGHKEPDAVYWLRVAEWVAANKDKLDNADDEAEAEWIARGDWDPAGDASGGKWYTFRDAEVGAGYIYDLARILTSKLPPDQRYGAERLFPHDPSETIEQSETTEHDATTADKRKPLPILWPADMQSAPLSSPYLVKGLLDQAASSVLYGDSNVGKTFVALDLALHVASGLDWFGNPVRQCAVLYIAAEAGRSAQLRVMAWMQHHPDAKPCFALVPYPISLARQGADIARIIDAIKRVKAEAAARGLKIGLVVIDTLSRALAGGNENSSEDMGALVRHCDQLRIVSGAHVMLIHHSGKNQALGARGHSLLRAAVETELEITNARAILATKQRDMEPGRPITFRLVPVALGPDAEGMPLTSCIVAETVPFGDNRPTMTEKELTAHSALETAIDEARDAGEQPDEHGTIACEWSAWLRAYSKATDVEDGTELRSSGTETALRRLCKTLTAKGYVTKTGKARYATAG